MQMWRVGSPPRVKAPLRPIDLVQRRGTWRHTPSRRGATSVIIRIGNQVMARSDLSLR